MRAPSLVMLLFCLFMSLSVRASQNITRCLEKCVTDFHWTYINDASWHRDGCVHCGYSGVRCARNSAFWLGLTSTMHHGTGMDVDIVVIVE